MNKEEFKQTYFSIIIDNTLTEFDRDVLNRLYLPIIGRDSLNLYNYFYSILEVGLKQSSAILHEELLNNLEIDINKFIDSRSILEAIGLMDTYLLNDHYFYVIKKVLSAYEFFNDDTLPIILLQAVGKDKYEMLNMDFLLLGHDLSQAIKVSKSFDEVFKLEEEKKLLVNGVNTINNGINIHNANIDLNYLKMRLNSDDLIEQSQLDDNFYNQLIRYCFLYNLKVDEIYSLIRQSIDIRGIVDLKTLERLVAKNYTSKLGNHRYVPISVNKDLDERVKYFENTTPDTIIYTKYKNHLTSSEIKMFDEILKETNVSVGYLNATIVYIDKEKKGSIPSKNYYLKVINTWLRKGIISTSSIIDGSIDDIINTKTTRKTKKPVSKWYQNQQEMEKKEEPKTEINNEKLITIEELFKVDGDNNG